MCSTLLDAFWNLQRCQLSSTQLLYATDSPGQMRNGVCDRDGFMNMLYLKCKVEDEKKPLKPGKPGSGIPIPKASQKPNPRREYYYMSARSLAGSGTPPIGTYMRAAKSGPSAMELHSGSSSEDESAHVSSKKSATQPRPIQRSVANYGTFLAASINLPLGSRAWMEARSGFTSRRLLHVPFLEHSMIHSAFGQWLGWLMAAIYMGGRIPQIWINRQQQAVTSLA
ncbi:hypothetical protein GOBAR_AA07601 [Gossypium barbadense]|uniref:Uncharacterized protein n=1 Tax=Gossypium barbadense TaxID=3634 RepID=A0A2P5YBT2_GOSBA|nr:hypothetical protein GOBAR_AA07601 [Gossypium barbadense]